MKTVISYSDENYKHKWALVNGDHIDLEGLCSMADLPFELMSEEEFFGMFSKEGNTYVDDEGEPIKTPEFALTITREKAEEYVRKGAKLIHIGSGYNFPNNICPLTMDGEYYPGLHELIPVLDVLSRNRKLKGNYNVSINITTKDGITGGL